MRALLALVVLLLLVGPAAATPVQVALPASFHVGRAALVSGDIEWRGGAVTDPVFAEPRALGHEGGVLTACPVQAPGGIVPALLANLTLDCQDGESFTDPQITFGAGTALYGAGTHAFTLGGPATLLLAADGLGGFVVADVHFEDDDGGHRFGPALSRSSIRVEADGDVRYFNGTTHGFVFTAGPVTWGLGAFGGHLAEAALDAGPHGDAAARDPFLLLDVQELLLGQDAREPRANVTPLLEEFGRAPAFVDGALYGHLNGTLGDRGIGRAPALLRGTAWHLEAQGGTWQGDVTPIVVLAPSSVAFGHDAPAGTMWVLGVVLWIIAAAVWAVRRRPVERRGWHRWVGPAAVLTALVIVDLFVLGRRFGARAFAAEDTPSLLALGAFEAVVVALGWLLVLVPVRLAAGRAVPERAQKWTEAGVTAVWLVTLLLIPAAYFATALTVARL